MPPFDQQSQESQDFPYLFNPGRITYFAKTDTRSRQTPFGIKLDDRTRHMYIIGKTGMGKSTLIENLVAQDIANGEGVAFIDPHGGSADKMLDYIPQHRINDVLYFAPFDLDHPIAFNVMEDVGYDKRHLVVSGLMSAFKKIWADQWSSRMEYILTNTLLALLEYPGSTMLGVNKMYADKDYRRKVVEHVKDPLVRSFWVDEFAKFTDQYTREATPAIQNKVGQFTGNPLVRNIVGQPNSSFDIRKMMDERKILIINLSKGRVGETNANLLGSMLITKIYLAAMSRADVAPVILQKMSPFFFFVDEFQSFANESFADILSEARKYKLSLTMAHQYIEQMSEEVRAAVFGNVGTMITFRVGAFDAEVLEKEFMPQFTAQDLVNLGFAQVYLRLMIDSISSQPFSATTLPPVVPPEASFREDVIERSRKLFSRPRAIVEAEIAEEYQKRPPVQTEGGTSAPREGGERRTMRDFANRGFPPRERVSSGSNTDRRESGNGAIDRPVMNVGGRERSFPTRFSRDGGRFTQGATGRFGQNRENDRENRNTDTRYTVEHNNDATQEEDVKNTKKTNVRPIPPPIEQGHGSLKDALAEALGGAGNTEEPVPSTQKTDRFEQRHTERQSAPHTPPHRREERIPQTTEKEQQQEKTPDTQKHEIPEDVLRKILEV